MNRKIKSVFDSIDPLNVLWTFLISIVVTLAVVVLLLAGDEDYNSLEYRCTRTDSQYLSVSEIEECKEYILKQKHNEQ